MKSGGEQAETVTVSGADTGFTKNVNGVRFSLEPEPSNRGNYPVHVVVNNDTANPVVVRGPGWEGEGSFTSLKVDVTPGGGVAQDKWRLYVAETAGDVDELRPRTNAEGFLAVRHGGPRVLFDLDSQQNPAAFIALVGQSGTFWIRPDAEDAFSTTPGEAWAVGEFSRVLFSVEQQAQSGTDPDWSFIPKAHGCAQQDGMNLRELTVGTVGEFGRASGTPWDSEPGALLLGAPGADAGPSWADTQSFFPRLRFSVTLASNSVLAALFTDPNFRVRLTAVAF